MNEKKKVGEGMLNIVDRIGELEVEYTCIMGVLSKENGIIREEMEMKYQRFKQKKELLEKEMEQWVAARAGGVEIHFVSAYIRMVIQMDRCHLIVKLKKRAENGEERIIIETTACFYNELEQEKKYRSVEQFVERLKQDIIVAKNHKLRALVQDHYVWIEPIFCTNIGMHGTNRIEEMLP